MIGFGYFPGYLYDYAAPSTPYEPPTLHIIREQAARERDQQRQARNGARRALSRVAGRRSHETSRAMGVRALSLKRAA